MFREMAFSTIHAKQVTGMFPISDWLGLFAPCAADGGIQVGIFFGDLFNLWFIAKRTMPVRSLQSNHHESVMIRDVSFSHKLLYLWVRCQLHSRKMLE